MSNDLFNYYCERFFFCLLETRIKYPFLIIKQLPCTGYGIYLLTVRELSEEISRFSELVLSGNSRFSDWTKKKSSNGRKTIFSGYRNTRKDLLIFFFWHLKLSRNDYPCPRVEVYFQDVQGTIRWLGYHIPVCLLCCLLVTIRGLVGLSIGGKVVSSSLGVTNK